MGKQFRVLCLLCMMIIVFIYSPSVAQILPDPVLVQEIAKKKIIDDHCHMLPIPYGKVPENILGAYPFDHPIFVRVDNAQWIGAWQHLWGYQYDDMEKKHLEEAITEKKAYSYKYRK